MALQEELHNLRKKNEEEIPVASRMACWRWPGRSPEAPAPEEVEKSDTALRIMSGETQGTAAGPMSRRPERRAACVGGAPGAHQ